MRMIRAVRAPQSHDELDDLAASAGIADRCRAARSIVRVERLEPRIAAGRAGVGLPRRARAIGRVGSHAGRNRNERRDAEPPSDRRVGDVGARDDHAVDLAVRISERLEHERAVADSTVNVQLDVGQLRAHARAHDLVDRSHRARWQPREHVVTRSAAEQRAPRGVDEPRRSRRSDDHGGRLAGLVEQHVGRAPASRRLDELDRCTAGGGLVE